jgi:hydrogenase nickel incorporation protein HypA/HybF
MEAVRVTEEFARANGVVSIEALVLQIGELSSMVPKYIEDIYPMAIEGTLLAGSRVEIEVIPANGRCRLCGAVYHAVEYKGGCPACGGERMELLSGREFNVKEIRCL